MAVTDLVPDIKPQNAAKGDQDCEYNFFGKGVEVHFILLFFLP